MDESRVVCILDAQRRTNLSVNEIDYRRKGWAGVLPALAQDRLTSKPQNSSCCSLDSAPNDDVADGTF